MNKHSLSMHCVFSNIFVYSANKVHIRVLCKGRLWLLLLDNTLQTSQNPFIGRLLQNVQNVITKN